MADVYLRGMGLSCALGVGIKDCEAGLAGAQVPAKPITLHGFEEPMSMPYYRIPDQAELFAPERFDKLLLDCVMEAMESGSLDLATEGIPVFVGSSAFSISKSEAVYRKSMDTALPMVGFQHVSDVFKKNLGASEASYAFNTACTAAANALMSAQRLLAMGRYKHALVVGFELANATTLTGFKGLQLIAHELKPFDLKRAGIVLGEGIGVALLSTEAPPPGGGPKILLKAGSANIDTYSVTTANPDGSSIAALQRSVLAAAGIRPEQVLGIKAHGTASPLNDTGEAAGLRAVFGELPPLCALKPYIGHTLGACGVNELLLLAAALKKGYFPGTPNFETEDPALKVRPTAAAIPAKPGHYLLNYFGFGGHNTALIMELAS